MTNKKTIEKITNKKELGSYLTSIHSMLEKEEVAPVYALSALNDVLQMEGVYDLLDQGNKEIARTVWLQLKKSGVQLENPPMLFDS